MARAGAVLLLLLATTARADEWTASDTALELTGATLHVLDYSQSLSTVGPNASRAEANPLLGVHPSTLGLTAYAATTLVLHAAVAYALPRPYRTIWQAAWIGLEAACVGHNVAAGVRFSLP